MRIAYVSDDAGIPVFGTKGASVHVRELSAALAALGHEVVLFARRTEGDRPAGFDLDVRTGAATLRAFRPDAVYERYSLRATRGGELARALGVPHLVEVNAPLADEAAAHRGLRDVAAARRVERQVLLGADAVIAVSTPLATWLERLGVASSRVTVLPNAVDPSRFAGGARRANDLPVVGFLGTLKPWHDVSSLVRAMRGLDARLLVIGDGPERGRLATLAHEVGVDATFTGATPHRDVPRLLAGLDVAVAPYASADVYFSPLKLFEYLAAGCAVVAADAGDIACCVRHGQSGLLYEPGDAGALADALRTLLGNPLLRERLGRAGRAHVRAHHTWERNARAVVDLVGLEEAA